MSKSPERIWCLNSDWLISLFYLLFPPQSSAIEAKDKKKPIFQAEKKKWEVGKDARFNDAVNIQNGWVTLSLKLRLDNHV